MLDAAAAQTARLACRLFAPPQPTPRSSNHVLTTIATLGDFGGIDFSKLAGGGDMPDLGDEDAEDVDSGDDEEDVEEIPTTKA